MTYFPCTASAYLTSFSYLLPILILWIAIYFHDKQKKKLTKNRLLICCLISIIYIVVVYSSTFISYFYGYKAEKATGKIEVQYIFPQRTKTLMVQDVFAVKTEPSYKGSYQTVIIMKNGKRHEGVPSLKIDAEDAEKKIRSAML